MARNIGGNAVRNIGANARFADRLDQANGGGQPVTATAAVVRPRGPDELNALAASLEYHPDPLDTLQQPATKSILKRGNHHTEDRKIDRKTGIQFTEDDR